jgi:coproporphyrinogen III oxidase
MPPKVKWEYNHLPEKDSEEDSLLKILQFPKDWA